MTIVRLEEIQDARAVLEEYLPRTRLVRAEGLERRIGVPVHLKVESELPTGSFKPRGALYALHRRLREAELKGEPEPTEVVASSTGNHGAAVAYAARRMGLRATIFLPEDPNPAKRARILDLGADVEEIGPDLTGAFQAARAHAERSGGYFLNDATDPRVPAGAGTIGLEVLEVLPQVRTVIVPMGDTALVRGVASALRSGAASFASGPASAGGAPSEGTATSPSSLTSTPSAPSVDTPTTTYPARERIRIIGVQAAGAPAYYLSWKEGRPIPTERCDTIAGGLATRTPEAPNVEAIRELVDDVVLVEDDEMLRAMKLLILDEHLVAEPAGAAAAAAALALEGLEGPAVVLLTGANLSAAMLEAAAGAEG
jgi:threonine dehydratase